MSSTLGTASYSVQVAVLTFDEISEPKELDAHIIEVDPFSDMSLSVFRDIFYHGGECFEINPNGDSTYLELSGSTVDGTPLNLGHRVIRQYQRDLEINSIDCMDPCSRIEIMNQLSLIKSLNFDCNVQCSLKFSEVIQCLIQSFPPEHNVSFGLNDIHRFIISVRLTNINSEVKDMIFRFNYSVQINDGSATYTQCVSPAVTHWNNTNQNNGP